MVISDPMAELPVRNAKYAKSCTELHLGNKSIDTLVGFEFFENLEVLWLNNNELTHLTGLEENFRIKKLYAQENQILTLKDILANFKFLDTLVLYNNQLRDLNSCLFHLKPCRRLTHLDLFGNPLAGENHYRLKVIKALPWLNILDRHRIKDTERAEAKALKLSEAGRKSAEFPTILGATTMMQSISLGEAAFRATLPMSTDTSRASSLRKSLELSNREPRCVSADAALGGTKGMLECLLDKISETVKIKRLLLKEEFLALDRRHEQVLPEQEFLRILDLYGLVSPDEVESTAVSMLLDQFEAPAPTRCQTLGRDFHKREVKFMDYIAFCAAVEPKTGGRDMDNRARRLEQQWREKNPAKSLTMRDLEADVKKTLHRRRKNEAALRRAMVKLDSSMLSSLKGSQTQFTRPTFQNCAEDMLDTLEELQLKNFFKKKDKDGNGFLSKEELREALFEMELVGRKPILEKVNNEVLSAQNKADNIFGNNIFDTVVKSTSSDQQSGDMLDVLFERMDSNKDGKISWKEFLVAVREGVGQRVPRVKWSWLTAEEADTKSKALFDKADRLYQSQSRKGTDIDVATQVKLGEIVSYANKLQSIARPTQRKKSEAKAEVFGRRDVFHATAYHFEDVESTPNLQKSEANLNSQLNAKDIEKLKKMFLLKDGEYESFEKQRSTRKRVGRTVSPTPV